MGSPQRGRQMQVGYVKLRFCDRSRSLWLKIRALLPYTTENYFVFIRHGGPRPCRCAGVGIRGVINNIGGRRSWLITVTVQLTSTRLVVWKSVDDTHG